MCETCKKKFDTMMGCENAPYRDFGTMDGHIIRGVPCITFANGVKTTTIRTFCGENIVDYEKVH